MCRVETVTSPRSRRSNNAAAASGPLGARRMRSGRAGPRYGLPAARYLNRLFGGRATVKPRNDARVRPLVLGIAAVVAPITVAGCSAGEAAMARLGRVTASGSGRVSDEDGSLKPSSEGTPAWVLRMRSVPMQRLGDPPERRPITEPPQISDLIVISDARTGGVLLSRVIGLEPAPA